jgi:hypothetical protein
VSNFYVMLGATFVGTVVGRTLWESMVLGILIMVLYDVGVLIDKQK